MSDPNDDMSRWLQIRPFQDNPERLEPSATQTSGTFDEWVKKGREIPDYEDRLIWILEHHKDPVIRSEGALALGFLGGDLAIRSLIKALKADIPLVAMEAAASLGRLGKSEALEPLCEALRNSDANVRASACTALAGFDEEEAISCLRKAERDQDPFVQVAAQEALRRNK